MTDFSLKDVVSWLPPRPRDSHKNDYGHVLVVGGSRGSLGAPRLAAWGALRGGAGLVTLAVPESLEPVAAVGPWEAMTLALPERAGALTARAVSLVRDFVEQRGVTAVVLGPGGGRGKDRIEFVRRVLLSLSVPVVVDADGLNALAALGPVASKAPLLLTPHVGEMARLLGTSKESVQNDREASARLAARRYRALVVLKGMGTLVSDGDRRFVNSTGNPAMASGGMGDLLAGLLGALVGQVFAEDVSERLWRASILGVYLHGWAGDLARKKRGSPSVLARDVGDHLSAAFRRLFRP